MVQEWSYTGGVDLLYEDGSHFADAEASFWAREERPGGLWQWGGSIWITEGQEPRHADPGTKLRCRTDTGQEGEFLTEWIDTAVGLGTRSNPVSVTGSGPAPF